MIDAFTACQSDPRTTTPSTCTRRHAVVASALLVATLSAASVEAATYYVSQSGNDGNSCAAAQSQTETSQKATIAAGVACLTAGDRLLIHGGTYTGMSNTIDSQSFRVPSGTSWTMPVTIGGVPGEAVSIQPPSNVSGIRLTSGSPSYVIVQDVTVDMANSSPGANAEGIFLYTAHHNRFERVEVKNAASFGVHFGDATAFNEILNSRIHHNGYSGSADTVGHGLYITSSDNLFEGNDVYDNEGYGFHIYNNSGSHDDPSRNVVRNNRIRGNGLQHSTAYGVVIAWGSDNVVANNVIYGNLGGIQVYTGASNTGIFNNTVYGNRAEGVALQYYTSSQTVRNNIVYANGAAIMDYGGSGTVAADHNLTANPNFANAAAGDFRPAPGSAAIDTGVAVTAVTHDFAYTPRPMGNGYDVGAFESGGAAVPGSPTNLRVVGY